MLFPGRPGGRLGVRWRGILQAASHSGRSGARPRERLGGFLPYEDLLIAEHSLERFGCPRIVKFTESLCNEKSDLSVGVIAWPDESGNCWRARLDKCLRHGMARTEVLRCVILGDPLPPPYLQRESAEALCGVPSGPLLQSVEAQGSPAQNASG